MGVIYKQEELINSSLDYPTLKLSAIVGADSFFYALESQSEQLIHLETHPFDHKLILFQDTLDFLSDLMVKNPLLFESFEEKRIGIYGIPYLIVDDRALEKESAVKLLSSVTHLAALDTICIQKIPAIDSVCLFAIPTSIKSEIELYFDHPKYLHVQGAVIQWISAHQQKIDTDRHICLLQIGIFLLLTAWENDALVFHNQFKCPVIEDIAYFFSATVEFLQWEVNSYSLSVSGNRKEEILQEQVLLDIYQKHGCDPFKSNWPGETAHFLDLYAVSKCAL